MKKKLLALSKKITLFVIFIFSLTYNSTYSQCTNQPPTGNASPVFCKSDNKTVGDLVTSVGTIVWYDAPSEGALYDTSEVLVNGGTYYADDISGGSCSTSRLAVTVIIYGDYPTNVDVSVGKCAVDNPTVGSLSAIGENIAWYDAQTGGNFLPLSTLLENGKTYWVQQSQNGCTSDRFPTMVSLIDPITPTTATVQSFCSSTNPKISNLIASGNVKLWYDSEISTTPLKATDLLINGEDYWVAEVTFPCVSSIRAKTTVVIDIAPNAGVSSSLTECEVSFMTTNLFDLLGGTPDTTGIWTGPSTLSNGYLGTFEPGINTVGNYTYRVSSDLGICPAESVTVSIIITIVPPPTITETSQSFCITDVSNTPTLADLVVDTIGSGNVVRWYADATSTVELPLTTTLVNNTTYFASQFDATSNCESAIRDSKTALIEIAPNAGTDGSYTDCEIDLVDTNLFSLLGGSPDASGTWTAPDGTAHSSNFVAGTDVAGIYTYTVAGGTICPDDTAIVTVGIVIIPAPIITNADQSFCIIDEKEVGDLVIDNSTATITWYDAQTGGNIISSDTKLISGQYWASQTDNSGCESVNRNVINVTIIDLQAPIASTNQTFCLAFKPTIASLIADGQNVLWFENETDDVTLALDATIELEDNKTYWAADVDLVNGCESFSRISTLVTLTDEVKATIVNVSQTFCESDFPTIENLEATGNGILWYATETSTVPLDDTSLLTNGTTYWAVQSNPTTGCVSSVRVVANVTLTTIATPTIISLGNEFCKIDNPTIADLNLNVSANNGGTISWYDTFPNGNLLNASAALVDGETYYAIETNVTGCKSTNPLEVTVTLESCDEYDVVIYDGFSPTGNGVNDTFKITNLRELYPDFKVEYFNRWGNLIYTASAASGDWNGRLNGDGELSPTGVYYFVIYFNKNDRKPIQRRLYLSR